MCDEYGTPNWPLNFDIWGADALGDYIKAFNPDVFVSALDLFMKTVAYIPQVVRQARVPWIAHVTINTDSLSPYLAQPLKQANLVVAPSQFDYRIIKNEGLPVVYIPHGVDTSKFYQLKEDEKQEIKRKLGVENKRLIGCVQRNNMPQKNFYGLFWAYKMLIENCPEARRDTLLVLLSYPFEERGVRLTDLTLRLGIQDHVKFVMVKPSEDGKRLELANFNDPRAFLNNPNWGLDELEMNRLYNAFDFTVIPSYGESFSLPAAESMACGVPVIMNSFSTGPELLIEGNPSPRGAVVKVRAMADTPMLTRYAIPDEADMARKMYAFFSNRELRERCGRNGAEFAKNNLTWKNHILPKWLKVLEEFEKPRPVDYQKFEMGI